MSKLKILFPDNIHFHEKNFKSLLDYINIHKFEKIVMTEFNEIKALYGNYENHKSLFLNEYDILIKLSKTELFKFKQYGVNIFELAKAEMLSYLMSKQNWLDDSISSDNKVIFEKAYNENKEVLLLNMSVTLFWLNFWHRKLGFKNYKNINISVIFSGSLIYVKTLSYLLQNTPIKVFVVEHFFTGNDYYFEEKYEHIANNSDIKYQNFFNTLKRDFLNSNVDYEKEKIKAINKLNLANNKNVKQPIENETIDFNNEFEKIVLILGQVVNDFSILETKLDNINSLDIYKELIKKIIKKTKYNIIFKAHPWEKNKINLKRSITKDELNKFIMLNFTENERKRIKIVEDFNIYKLFHISNYIIGICSQSLLEAAYIGKKTHQIGKSFFGNKGFTYDYNTIDEFILNILQMPNEKLTIQEYNLLLEFFTIILQHHLVSIHKSGQKTIKEKLQIYKTITLVHKKSKSFLIPSLKKINDNTFIPNDNLEAIKEKEIVNNSILKTIIEQLIYFFSSDKKIKKFKENPKKFFSDSNYSFIKFLGKLYLK